MPSSERKSRVEHVKKEKKFVGFNVATEQYVDMFEAGIIDPTKVARAALQNAASAARTSSPRSQSQH